MSDTELGRRTEIIKRGKRISELEAKLDEAVGALEYYASPISYDKGCMADYFVIEDGGYIARQSLEKIKEKP
jgi:hypothetical protein